MAGESGLKADGASDVAPPVASLARRIPLAVKFSIAFVALVTLVLLVNGAVNLWLAYGEARRAAVLVSQEKAQAAAERIGQFVNDIESQIGWTTRSEWSRTSPDQRRYDFIRLLQHAPAITEVRYIDSDGKEQQKQSRLDPDVVGSGVDYSADPRFTEAVAKKVWYGPIYFRHGSEPYFTLSVAHGRKPPGVTSVEVNLKLIWDVVTGIRVGDKGFAYIVNAQGHLLAHPDMSLVLRDTDMLKLPQVAKALAGAGEAEPTTGLGQGLDGTSVLSAHAGIARLGWTVFVQLPLSEALAPVYAALGQTAALLGLGIVLATAVGTILARRMVEPIARLQAGAERLGAGDLSQRIAIHTGDEIETLADRFNAMAGQVQESHENLEGKVEARTRELGEALARQTATSDILRVISQSPTDTRPVFEAIALTAVKLLRCDRVAVQVVDGNFILPKATATARGLIPGVGLVHDAGDTDASFPARALAAKQTLYLPDWSGIDLPEKEKLVQAASGTASSLYVPMLRGGEGVGLLIFVSKQANAFDAGAIAQAESFADQALIAIENTRLFNETQEALEQQKASADVLDVISRSVADASPVFEKILEACQHLFRSEEIGIFTIDDAEMVRVAAWRGSRAEEVRNDVTPLAGSITGRIIRERRVHHIPYQSADPLTSRVLRERVVRLGDVSVVYAPMLLENTGVGSILVLRTPPRPFTLREQSLLQGFANQAAIAIQNARLFNETREALERQTATADILKVIASSPSDVQPVFDAIAASANRLLGGFSTTVFRVFGDAMHLVALTQTNPVADEALQALFPMPLAAFLPYEMVRNGEAVQFADTEAETGVPLMNRELARLRGYRSMLFTALMSNTVPIGLISVTRREPGRFAAHHVQLLQTFADQAVIAIQNLRLFNETQEALQQQTATADVLKAISRTAFDLDTVLDTLISTAARLCNAHHGEIFRREGDVYLHAASKTGLDPAYDQHERKAEIRAGRGTVVGRAVLERRAVRIADAWNDPDYQDKDAARLGGVRAMLGVPLMREGEPIGAFALARSDLVAFSEREVELVTTFADQAVIAIENARLFDEVQARTRDLSESLEYQTATGEVLKVIGRSPSQTQPVLDMIVSTAQRLCQSDSAHIMRLESGKQHLVSAFNMHPNAVDFLSKNPIAPGRGSVTGRVTLEGRTLQVPDVLADPDYTLNETQRRVGCRTILCVPLLNDGVVIGVINLLRLVVRPFTQRQIDLVTAFADQAVIAIENARLFDEVEARTRDLGEALQQQTATADVLKVISRSAFDLQSVLDTLINSAVRVCGASQGSIYQKIGYLFHWVTQSEGLSAEFIGFGRAHPIAPGNGTLTGRVALTGKVVHIEDVLADPDYTLLALQRLGNYRTMLGVPLLREGVPIGVFTLNRTHVQAYTDRQIELVTSFADQAVIAIENARLFEAERARTRELAASLDNLRATQDRLLQTEKLASLGQLTAGIAHEIKNPLNFVNNFADVSSDLVAELQDALAPGKAALDAGTRAAIDDITGMLKANLAKVTQHGRRADSIVKNMLLHSRTGSSERRKADLNSIVEESLNLAYHGARAEKPGFNITLEKSFDPAVGQIEIFPQEFTRVLLNLMSNGFYAATKRKTEAGEAGYEPRLAVATKSLGAQVEITIRDNGTGIPDDVKAKMFNPFFTTKPAGEGTGLGLSLSFDIIKQHGGSIAVATEPGAFTQFTILLPNQAASAMKPEPSA